MAAAGRRPGTSRTRAAVLAAARAEFAARGFETVTVRQIAARAGVDAAMISHHFGSKAELFRAALQIPVDPAAEIASVLDGPPDQLGARLLSRLLVVWDSPDGAGALAAIRTALQREETALLVREFALSQVLRPVMATLDGPAEERLWRANLLAGQVIGLILARYVLGLQPLASAGHADVVAAVAPTLQRYLTGPLDGLTPVPPPAAAGG